MSGPVHYEVYVRKTAVSPWTLLMATEDRTNAVETAEDTLLEKRAVAVRVTRETLDPETRAFSSFTLLTKGTPEASKKRVADKADNQPGCTAPQDLYTPQARELIGRVLDDWLMRQGVTAWELLHRPDLVERLEASGVELQHAMQKVVIPESQVTGLSTHDLMRHYQKLVEAAMERVVVAGRKRVFAVFADRSLADVTKELAGAPDRTFVLSGVLAASLSEARGARLRLGAVMDIVDQAPPEGPGRAMIMATLEPFLCELLSRRSSLAEILGPSLDQGGSLAAVVRLVVPHDIERLIASDPRMALMTPVVEGPAARLGERLAAGDFPALANSLARMVLRELTGPRRLRPTDPHGEIDILRTLATALSGTAGRLLSPDEVASAFIERSKSLVTADFVQAYASACGSALSEVEGLTRLCENVMGAANKRAAARWLAASVSSLKFENEMRASTHRPQQKLKLLAGLQRSVRASALAENDEAQINAGIGAIGGSIETEAKLITQIGRAPAPLHQKLAALLRLAAGETAPVGPVADRAKAEAVRLLRIPTSRAELTAEPAALVAIRPLMQAAGLAA